MDYRGDRQREELLEEIERWHFAATEWNLFLDTHPESKEALRDYNQAVETLKALEKEYENRYGPLFNHGHSTSAYPWQWVEEPWPWQAGI